MADTISDELAIWKVKHRFCHAIDTLDTERLLATCATDASLDVPLGDEPAVGHDAIAEYLEWYGNREYGTRAHNVFNPIVDVDGDTATGMWYYMVLYTLPDGGLEVGQGQFDDEFVRTDEGWKLSAVTAQRHITRTLPAERFE